MSKPQVKLGVLDSLFKKGDLSRVKYALIRRIKGEGGSKSGQASTAAGGEDGKRTVYAAAINQYHSNSLTISRGFKNQLSPTLGINLNGGSVPVDDGFIALTLGLFRRFRIDVTFAFSGDVGPPFGRFYINIAGVDTPLFYVEDPASGIYDTGYVNIPFKDGDNMYIWFNYFERPHSPITNPHSINPIMDIMVTDSGLSFSYFFIDHADTQIEWWGI